MKLWKDKDFNKKLFSLVLPIAFQQFMLNLVSASDAIMLTIVGQSELSAVSLAGQVQFVLGLFLAAITIGTSIFAAQYWGKKDIRSVEKVFAIAIRLAVPVSALFTLGTALFPTQIMHIFTSEGGVDRGRCEIFACGKRLVSVLRNLAGVSVHDEKLRHGKARDGH